MSAIGALVTVLAAGLFGYAGLQMIALQTVDGNTVAEIFDRAMGVFSFGMAALTLLAGIAVDRLIASVSKAAGDPRLTTWGQQPPQQ